MLTGSHTHTLLHAHCSGQNRDQKLNKQLKAATWTLALRSPTKENSIYLIANNKDGGGERKAFMV